MLKWVFMRFVGLIVVVAIVYVCFYKGTDKQSPAAKVEEAQKEANAVEPVTPVSTTTASRPAPPPASSGTNSLKAPIDRTRAVLEKVKERNEE